MEKIIFSSTAILAIILIIFTIFISLELDTILKNNQKIEQAIELSMISLDFNVENFHTQLEVWEYAYLPNSERLDAFYIHRTTLDGLLNKWDKQIKEAKNDDQVIYKNGVEDMISISDSLELVKKDWVGVIEAILNYQEAIRVNDSEERLSQLRNISEQKIIANEELFDNLSFNKNVDIFVINQKSMIQELQDQQEKSINDFKIILIILIPITVTICMITNFVIIKKVKN